MKQTIVRRWFQIFDKAHGTNISMGFDFVVGKRGFEISLGLSELAENVHLIISDGDNNTEIFFPKNNFLRFTEACEKISSTIKGAEK